LENYKPPKGCVVNFSQTGTKEFQGIEVDFLPHFIVRKCFEDNSWQAASGLNDKQKGAG
jgi:hypothetical protein